MTSKRLSLLYIIAFIAFFLITRLPGLGTDVINPDAVNWHFRSQQFTNALKSGDFESTYQHYHPGVTLMWVAGVPIELYKQISGIQHYSTENFLTFHLIAKISVVFAQLALTLIVLFLLKQVFTLNKAILAVALFTFEPFFVGNSRLFHMDILFTLLVLVSILFAYVSIKENSRLNWFYVTTAAFFGSLSFLTRSVGIGVLVFIVMWHLFSYFSNRSQPFVLKMMLAFVISFVLFTSMLFPALWVEPIKVLSDIFQEGERIGVVEGHNQIFLGRLTMDAGMLFYPVVLLLKTSPAILFGVFLYIYFALKRSAVEKPEICKLMAFLTIFYLGYLAAMTFPSKKIDRYLLVIYPWLGIFAFCGYSYLLKTKTILIYAVYATFVVVPLVTLYPYYFTYTSPLFGSPSNANNVVGQKSFGVGILELRDFLTNKYGSDIKMGFYDTKPMKSIYPNSKVYDIRVTGTNDYDVLVLAINEEFPVEIIGDKTMFEKSTSLYINGLEYWRIYDKRRE